MCVRVYACGAFRVYIYTTRSLGGVRAHVGMCMGGITCLHILNKVTGHMKAPSPVERIKKMRPGVHSD